MIFYIKSNVSLNQLAMPLFDTLGSFHNVTTHVENCYDSLLKFITLAQYAELLVHFNRVKEHDVP